MTPTWDLILCQKSAPNSGKHFLTFTSLLKDLLKDIDEEPDEEIYKTRSGRVPSTGASVPVKLGCIALLVLGYVHQPGSSLNTILLGFFGGLLIQAYQLLTPFLAPFQASNYGLVFLVTSLHPKAHPESPHQKKRCSQGSYHLGTCKGLRSPVPGMGRRSNIYY